ncbi:MAG: hypothetical protein GX422_13350, partial [Deltaproteobacteria bacterium]|nr:hypothetical protein [Deltaproteobacteria bacterium]
GTICFISHDRHFINRIAGKILVADKGTVHVFPGNYQDYQSIWKKRLDVSSPSQDGNDLKQGMTESIEAPSRKAQNQKRLEAQWRNELYRLKAPLQERITRLESLAEEAQRQLQDLGDRLADPKTYQEGSLAQELQLEYHRCQERIRQLTEQWEDASLALEELERDFWKDKDPVPGQVNNGPVSERHSGVVAGC